MTASDNWNPEVTDHQLMLVSMFRAAMICMPQDNTEEKPKYFNQIDENRHDGNQHRMLEEEFL